MTDQKSSQNEFALELECYYDGQSYPQEEEVCCGITKLDCSGGMWVAIGSCLEGDTPVNPNVGTPDPGTTSENIGSQYDPNNDLICYYNGKKYSRGARICFEGTVYACGYGRWLADGTSC